jgi:hypothetical protein
LLLAVVAGRELRLGFDFACSTRDLLRRAGEQFVDITAAERSGLRFPCGIQSRRRSSAFRELELCHPHRLVALSKSFGELAVGLRKLLVQLLGTSFEGFAQGSVVLLYLFYVLRADCRLRAPSCSGVKGGQRTCPGGWSPGREGPSRQAEPLGAAFQFAERCLLSGQRARADRHVAERLHLGLGRAGCASSRQRLRNSSTALRRSARRQ